jgi:hypothetical protein
MNGLSGVVASIYNTFEPDLRVSPLTAKTFRSDAALLARVRQIPGLKAVSLSLSDKVLIKNGDKQALVTIKGVDTVFRHITRIDSAIYEGAYKISELPEAIVLGRGIALQLHVNLNVFSSELSLFSPLRGKVQGLTEADGLNQIYCRPCGIFMLNDELDYQTAFVSLSTARRLLDAEDQVSSLEIACEADETQEVKKALKTLFGSDYSVKTRYELNDVLFKSLETEKLATFIILSFILVIATFNIIGALTMLIIEKKKDIRTLMCLGADLRLIRQIFMREALLICGIGALAGLLLGLGVCWAQMKFHLVTFGSEFVVPYYPIELQGRDFAGIFGLIMLIGLVAAIYPVRVFTKGAAI